MADGEDGGFIPDCLSIVLPLRSVMVVVLVISVLPIGALLLHPVAMLKSARQTMKTVALFFSIFLIYDLWLRLSSGDNNNLFPINAQRAEGKASRR
jgi:hypothetical protein